MAKGKHRKASNRRRGATVAAIGVLGAGASMLATANPASAATTSTVSDVQIARLAANAGLAGCGGASLGTWVAVALAESGGNPYAHATVGEDSRGLWQINMRAHGGWVGGRNLYDPSTNAWAARTVCVNQGVRAWSTYTNGMYARFQSRGASAAAAVSGGLSVRTIAYTPSPKASTATSVAATTSGYPSLASGRGFRLDVRQIQQRLANLGYPIAVDGQFGYQTNHMVKDYQLKHGLIADGVVGPQTRARLGL
ncbi:peptidoglycan-binding protein [Frankia sp. AgPm24]|uniref:Peptidoglycan-binding protein n=1 Tax=Frankia umida TaxID=573489 RepID=A0ABT0JVM5_9ACTN|nr:MULTISPECIES: peptidoglycan-binding protein [Frankia]MCK9875277.1 peptidoglycan-binding protein [Frankia umida]MCK9924811.1 peptidoglycan-binding protein [Frankia sp. AgPm24]